MRVSLQALRSIRQAFLLGALVLGQPSITWAAPALEAQVRQALAHTHISKIQWGGKTLWIKGVDPDKQSQAHCLKKKLLQKLLPSIAAPTATCGQETIALEKKRLQLFHQNSLPAPELVGSGPDWLALSDLGTTLEIKIRYAPPAQRRQFLLRGLEALHTLHRHGIVHGRPVLRDMAITQEGHIGFLDLSEDPLSFMSFEEAQLRDFWLYIYGAWSFLREDPLALRLLVAQVFHHMTPHQQEILRHWQGIAWTVFSMLKPFWHLLTGDARKLLEILKMLQTEQPQQPDGHKSLRQGQK